MDYTAISEVLTFSGTVLRKCANISITSDELYEEDENFFVTLTTSDSDVTLNPVDGEITIIDDDGRMIMYSIDEPV